MTDATALLPGLDVERREVRGASVRCFTGGEGPPLLLLHGFGGAAVNFTGMQPLLAGRRLVVPDLPGHGGSTPLPAPSLSAFADAVAGLLDGPTGVLGHSMGAVVGLRLAARHPELVSGLVLAAPAGISSSSRIGQVSVALVAHLRPARALARHADRVAASRRLRRLVFGLLEVANPDLLDARAVAAFLGEAPLHTDIVGAGTALVRGDPRTELDRVRCPALVLFGGRDRQVPLADGFEYARRLRAPLRVIADCGHLLIGERPDVCARAALEFLAPR